jgi:hypothetical protein
MNEEELMNPTIRNCKFAYKCDKDWDDLDDIGESDIRFCQTCQSEVHFCHDDDELVENVKLDHCVAFLNDQGFLLMGDINRSN